MGMSIEEHIGVIEDLKSTMSVCMSEPENRDMYIFKRSNRYLAQASEIRGLYEEVRKKRTIWNFEKAKNCAWRDRR